MDINPLIVCEHGQGVAIADALIVTAEITTLTTSSIPGAKARFWK